MLNQYTSETLTQAAERANKQLGLGEPKKQDTTYKEGNTPSDFIEKVPRNGLKPGGIDG